MRVKNYNRYSNSLKRKVAKAYISGEESYAILAEENGLRDKTVVKGFVKWHRRKLELEPGSDIKTEIPKNTVVLSEKELQVKVRELEKELKPAKLKAEMPETSIDLAEGQFNIDIGKKSGAKQ